MRAMNVRLESTGCVAHAFRRVNHTFARETLCGRLFSFMWSTETEDEVDCMACIAAPEALVVWMHPPLGRSWQ